MSTVTIRQEDPQQAATTPTAGRALRRAGGWAAGIALAVLVAFVIVIMIRGGVQAGTPLAPDNPGPGGTMALAEVLRQQGVEVIEADRLSEVESAADGAGDVTIVLSDLDRVLDSDQRERVLDAADTLVVLEPTFFEVEDLAPGVAMGGALDGVFDADCDVAAVEKAGSVEGDGRGYRLLEGESGLTACLADGDTAGLVVTERGGTTVALVGLTSALANGGITAEGNAALALNLLGEHERLIWYLPGTADLGDQGPVPISELTPPWVTPLAVMLLVVALGAILWRARRVGPLVVEDLPVIVRAGETMEGRARLYERADARLHALDALRIGAIARLARSVGLSRQATVAEVVDAVAERTGRDRVALAGLLVDRDPQTDAELVALSDELLTLETETAARSRPQ